VREEHRQAGETNLDHIEALQHHCHDGEEGARDDSEVPMEE
jgi:hypothetical protein